MVWFLPLLKAIAGKGAAGGAVKGAVAKGGGAIAKGAATASRAAPLAARAPAAGSMASALKPGMVQGAQAPGLAVKPNMGPAQLGPIPTQSGPSMMQRFLGGDPKGEQGGMMDRFQQQGGGGGSDPAAEEQARLDQEAAMGLQELKQMFAEQRARDIMQALAGGSGGVRNPYLTGGR